MIIILINTIKQQLCNLVEQLIFFSFMFSATFNVWLTNLSWRNIVDSYHDMYTYVKIIIRDNLRRTKLGYR